MPNFGNKTEYSAQAMDSDFGFRSKFAARGAGGKCAGGNALRSARGGTCENKPNWAASANSSTNSVGMGRQRSPRLGPNGSTNSVRPLFPSAGARRPGGSTFGTDITNIAGKTDKPKAMKQEPPIATPLSIMEASVTEGQLVTKTETENVQEVQEYVSDINNQLFEGEATFPPKADYMEMQADLTPKMRTILMDWLIEVHMKYKLHVETLHLTVNLIDRFLAKVPVTRKRLQLIGVVAMFIASKYEEINPPELHDWVYITDKAYSKQDVLVMECTMLTTLNFQIMVPTAAHFFPALLKANGCNDVHRDLALYIVELGILDIRMLQYTPSQQVSAALLLSNELLGRCPVWPQSMVQQSRSAEADLRSCVEVLRQQFESDRAGAGGQLQAVHKKFSMKERHSVATMKF